MHLQCEITSIIKELDDLDLSDARNGGMLYRLRRNEWYEGLDRTQKDLLEKLQEKLVVYGKYLEACLIFQNRVRKCIALMKIR